MQFFFFFFFLSGIKYRNTTWLKCQACCRMSNVLHYSQKTTLDMEEGQYKRLYLDWEYSSENFCSELALVPESDLKISKFKLQSHYHVYFRKKTLGKRYDPPTTTLPATGYIESLLSVYKDNFCIKLSTNADMPLNK